MGFILKLGILKEQEYLRGWIAANGAEKMEKLLYTKILNEKKRAAYPTSVLGRLIREVKAPQS